MGIENVDESGWKLVFSNASGDVSSDVIDHSDGTEWFHISSCLETSGTIFLAFNAKKVGSDILDTSTFIDITSFLIPELRPQILPLIGTIHYGPLWLQPMEIIPEALSVFPANYLYPSSGSTPQFELFNPRVVDKAFSGTASGFYSLTPPGGIRGRLPANTSSDFDASQPMQIPKSFRIDCYHFCFHDTSICVEECSTGLVFNPGTCVCEIVPTKSFTTTKPVSTSSMTGMSTVMTSSGEMTSTTETQSEQAKSTSTGWIWYLILAAVSLITIILWRKRRVKKIVVAPSRRGSEILPLWVPHIEMTRTHDFFIDTTLIN
jgi:hypothetical protein